MRRELVAILSGFAKQRTFTAATIATLVVGIAAPVALFSTVNAVLLRPLPYPRAGDLNIVRKTITDGRYTSGLAATAELAGLEAGSRDVLHATGAIPVDHTPRLNAVSFDGQVWLFALGTTLVTGVIVGVVPALRSSGTDPSAVINE